MMPYSQSLADRIRWALRSNRNVEEKKMFGGVGFLLNRNMLVGVWESSLIVRLGPETGTEALKQPHVKEFDVTGRPMKGWVMVEPDGLDTESQLSEWIEQAMRFVETLPAK
jgi:TfoX/Sxy family transcriptional regulator of competence genes